MKKLMLLIGISVLFAAHSAYAAFSEPSMADYTVYPINTTQSVPPNIMIILDNSGSMNFNAYGTYPGDGMTVSDAPFTGEPYSGVKTFQVSSLQDDAEEQTAAGSVTYYNNGDLDIGGFSVGTNDAIMGLRFQNVAIPQGVTVHSAYIEFMSNDYQDVTTNILIQGEASDNAAPFDLVADNIKSRPGTTATVAWDDVPTWNAGVAYPTADITSIVQEIVNRSGWASGNAMVFRFRSNDTGSGNKRDAKAYDTSAKNAPKLHVVFSSPSPATRYYGYFNPDFFYKYSSNVFSLAYKKVNYDFTNSRWNAQTLSGSATTLDNAAIVNGSLWDGNWLNWLCMRRIDVLRKVLMGGKATARTGGGNQVNYGENPNQSYRVFYKKFDSYLSAVSPYNGNYSYRMEGGNIYVGSGNSPIYCIRIQKDINYEPEEFKDGNLAGVLQRVGDKARWGNIWFNIGTGSNQSGGTVEHTIGTNITTMITDLQNTGADTNTPLAESYYVAMQYFKQQNPESGLDYSTSAVPDSNLGDDPYYNGKQFVPCVKSFVLLLTDGASTRDAMIPDTYKNYSGDDQETGTCTDDSCLYPSGGSDYLQDLALYARTNDLRPDLDGDQKLIFYIVHAFDNDPNATTLLSNSARNGGFDDQNGNNKPDLTSEWDKNNDGVPDTYYEASDGYSLEAQLLAAITSILNRAASGTTASVLATNALGAGNAVQSYYRPLVTNGLTEAHWLGYLQSLWVDPWGNLREDSNDNHQLDLRSSGSQSAADNNVDKIVEMVNNGADTILRRYTKHYLYNSDNGSSGDCAIADCSVAYEDVPLDDLKPLFEAGKVLSQRDPDTRKIFTYIGDSGVVSSNDDSFDASGDVVNFNTTDAAKLKPFLGVSSDTAWGDKGAGLGSDAGTRVSNIIKWVRGTDISGLRNRTLAGVTWRLGDIVNSTPIVVGPASEYYNLIYSDKDYQDFINYAKNRETVVYVGGNDGMMHAFTSWVPKKKDDANQTLYYEPLSGTTDVLGTELWAYIPQAVLPHLKWDASEDYTHTFYVNGEPRVFDAKILANGTHYNSSSNKNYGTFMVFGLNMGGKDISVDEDFGGGTATVRNFSPTYVMMDITDPRNPRVMWERSYSGLGMSTSVPAPVHIGSLNGDTGKWFLVFGSGATDYGQAGSDLQPGHIFVVDMLTGQPYGTSATEDWIWQSPNNSYFNSPLALDVYSSNNTDAIYLAENYYNNSGSIWKANLYKMTVPCSQCEWDTDNNTGMPYSRDQYQYSDDPHTWTISELFASDGPVTAKLNAASDPLDNNLLYFGTGRYLNDADKTDTNQQYLYSIKDPFYNKDEYDGTYYHSFSSSKTLTPADLVDATNITVTTGGNVSGYNPPNPPNPIPTNFWDFVDDVREHQDGWSVSLNADGTNPSERIITQTAVFGGLFLVPTFTPSDSLCSMGGLTTFLGGYYETGTGYILPVFTLLPAGAQETTVSIRSPSSYIGMPPSRLVVDVGQQHGATIDLQLGTGEFLQLYGHTAISNENGIMESYDDPSQNDVKNPACTWDNFPAN